MISRSPSQNETRSHRQIIHSEKYRLFVSDIKEKKLFFFRSNITSAKFFEILSKNSYIIGYPFIFSKNDLNDQEKLQEQKSLSFPIITKTRPVQPSELENLENANLCDICLEFKEFKGNDIIFCDFCNVPVHYRCYGSELIESISSVSVDKDWYCQRCDTLLKNQWDYRSIKCVFCPEIKGSLKLFNNTFWAHVSCVSMIPDLKFENQKRENVIIEKYNLERHSLECNFCKIKYGACLQCDAFKQDCTTSFHITCAQRNGLIPNFNSEMKNQKYKINSEESKKSIYCKVHENLHKKNIILNLMKITINRKNLTDFSCVLSGFQDLLGDELQIIDKNEFIGKRNRFDNSNSSPHKLKKIKLNENNIKTTNSEVPKKKKLKKLINDEIMSINEEEKQINRNANKKENVLNQNSLEINQNQQENNEINGLNINQYPENLDTSNNFLKPNFKTIDLIEASLNNQLNNLKETGNEQLINEKINNNHLLENNEKTILTPKSSKGSEKSDFNEKIDKLEKNDKEHKEKKNKEKFFNHQIKKNQLNNFKLPENLESDTNSKKIQKIKNQLNNFTLIENKEPEIKIVGDISSILEEELKKNQIKSIKNKNGGLSQLLSSSKTESIRLKKWKHDWVYYMDKKFHFDRDLDEYFA